MSAPRQPSNSRADRNHRGRRPCRSGGAACASRAHASHSSRLSVLSANSMPSAATTIRLIVALALAPFVAARRGSLADLYYSWEAEKRRLTGVHKFRHSGVHNTPQGMPETRRKPGSRKCHGRVKPGIGSTLILHAVTARSGMPAISTNAPRSRHGVAWSHKLRRYRSHKRIVSDTQPTEIYVNVFLPVESGRGR